MVSHRETLRYLRTHFDVGEGIGIDRDGHQLGPIHRRWATRYVLSRRTSLRAAECDGQLYFQLRKPECGGLDRKGKGSFGCSGFKSGADKSHASGPSFENAGFEINGP